MTEAKRSSYNSPWQLFMLAFGLLTAALWNGRVIAHQLLELHSTSDRLHQSVTVMPLDTAPYLKLAELNPIEEIADLKEAIQRNPWDTVDSLRLSADLELSGDVETAKRVLEAAVAHDKGLGPRWALANFYLRRGNKNRVFEIINAYRNLSPQPNVSLLRLSTDSAASLDEALSKLSNLSCRDLAALLTLADERDTFSRDLLRRESNCDDSDSRHSFALHVSHLLAEDHPQEAKLQWEHSGLKDSLMNADFRNPISEVGFDWRENRSPGIMITQPLAPDNGIDFRIGPEAIAGAVLIFQPIILQPNTQYQFKATVNDQNAAITSLRAELVEMTTGRTISSGFAHAGDWIQNTGSWNFIAPSSVRTLAVAFVYVGAGRIVATEQDIQVKNADLTVVQN